WKDSKLQIENAEIEIAQPVTGQRSTIDGSAELEEGIAELCADTRAAVEAVIPNAMLEGILLGGGYGRGEGGVLQTANGERPYNDLEFYVFLKGSALVSERKFQPLLHEQAHRLSQEAGIEIELRATSFRKLRRSPANMFYYDLVMGHRWILGEESLLE